MRSGSGKGNRILAATASAVLALTMTAAPVFAADSGMEKEETVYVVTDSSGAPEDITVSDHLKNGIKSDDIIDESNLTEIENVKGDEPFKKGKGDQIIWKAGGNDIYYDGKTTDTPPVTMDIDYTLDGEEIQGKELEGKSGELKMTFKYENHESVNVNGQDTVVPFFALTGFIVRDNALTDITIDNGKILDDGDKQIVVGMAAPGLREDLNLDKLDVDIDLDDGFTVRGTAHDFSVQDIMTVVTNSVFEDLDDEDLADLDYDDQIAQLEKGAKELVSGTDLLYQGIHTLNGKMPKLENGVGQLKDGSEKLKDGTSEALDGSKKLSGGLSTLGEELKESMSTVVTATSQLKDGADQVLAGMKQIKGGLDGDGTTSNPGAINTLYKVAKDLDPSIQTNSVQSTEQSTDQSADKETAETGKNTQSESAGAAKPEESESADAAQSESSTTTKTESSNSGSGINADEAAALAEYLKEVDAAVSKHSGALKAAGYGDLVGKTGTMKSYAQKLASSAGSKSTSSKSVSKVEIQEYITVQDNPEAAATIKAVADGLKKSSDALGAYEPDKGQQQTSLIGAMTVIDGGLEQLNKEVSQAIDPEGTLTKGLAQLTQGSSDLVSGQKQIADGANGLADGMNALEDKTYQLSDGVTRLNSGSIKLRDGMSKMYREGIRKIVDLYNNDLKGSIDDLQDTIDAGQEYKTFTRLPEGMDGKVKFIYKTSIY